MQQSITHKKELTRERGRGKERVGEGASTAAKVKGGRAARICLPASSSLRARGFSRHLLLLVSSDARRCATTDPRPKMNMKIEYASSSTVDMDGLEPAHKLALDLFPIEPLLLILLDVDDDVAELINSDRGRVLLRLVVVLVVRRMAVVRVAEPKVVVRVRIVLQGGRSVRGLGVALCNK